MTYYVVLPKHCFGHWVLVKWIRLGNTTTLDLIANISDHLELQLESSYFSWRTQQGTLRRRLWLAEAVERIVSKDAEV